MNEISLDDLRLKELLKTVILELLQEQKGVFYDLVTEIIEDIALEKAIKDGENTEKVSRENIFRLLDNPKWM